MTSAAEVLMRALRAHAQPAELARLEAALPRTAEPLDRARFFGAYAGAGRRFPGALAPSADEVAALRAVGIAEPSAWSQSDAARVVLLLGACAATNAAEHVALASEAFRKGDNAERIALLRALALLPEPARFVGLAAEACRTHVEDVFAALACENPYPARHMPDAAFRQLVLKAVFLGVSIDRILGWRARNDEELRRMARDYAAERRAAGRPVPEDIARIEAPTENAR